MSQTTVPAPVRVRFAKVATAVCQQAKLDYLDWAETVAELNNDLEQKWINCCDEVGLNDDAAQQEALRLFDPPSAVRHFRKPWLVRLWSYERYRPQRQLVFLAAYLFYCWLTIMDVHLPHDELDGHGGALYMAGSWLAYAQVHTHSDDPDGYHRDAERLIEFASTIAPLDLHFFTDGLGSGLLGLATVMSAMVIRWQPKLKNLVILRLLNARYILCGVVLFALFRLIVYPSCLAYDLVQQYVDGWYWWVGVGLHFGGILLGWFGASCLILDTFAFPRLMNKLPDQHLILGLREKLGFGLRRAWPVVLVIFISLAVLGIYVCFPLKWLAWQIADADRVVATDSSGSATISITGSDVKTLIRDVSEAERVKGPYEPSYALVKYFKGSKYLGSIEASAAHTFFFKGRKYYDLNERLNGLVVFPLERAAHKASGGLQDGK
jgi:hypothetical protein